MENKKIEDYIILTNKYKSELRNDVLQKISEGYEPIGGVSISDDSECCFAQAMIKYSIKI